MTGKTVPLIPSRGVSRF
jgi:hypothetical protein